MRKPRKKALQIKIKDVNLVLGLKSKIKGKKSLKFNENMKRQIVEDYLQSGLPKNAIWEKYTDQQS